MKRVKLPSLVVLATGTFCVLAVAIPAGVRAADDTASGSSPPLVTQTAPQEGEPQAVPTADAPAKNKEPGTIVENEESETAAPKTVVALTKEAADQIRELIRVNNLSGNLVCLIGVREGGNVRFKNGGETRYHYTLRISNEVEDLGDFEVAESQDLKIAVAKEIAHLLRGTVIRWHDEAGTVGFRYDNPNETVLRIVTSQPAPPPTPAPQDAN